MNNPRKTGLTLLLGLAFVFLYTLFGTQASAVPLEPETVSAGPQLYWSDKETGFIWHANLDGSGAEWLPGSLGEIEALAINPIRRELYFVEDASTIVKTNLNGGDRQVLASGYPLLSKPGSLVPHIGTNALYWTDAAKPAIGRYDLLSEKLLFQLPLGSNEANGIAIDEERRQIYWLREGYVYRSNFDGSDAELLPNLLAAGDIAFDEGGNKIYYTESFFDFYGYNIKRASLDGSGVETVASFAMGRSDGLALDSDHDKVYWSDRGQQPRIWRANLDGTEQEAIVDEGIFGPFGIALDTDGGKLYWTDWVTQKIQRANLDGSEVEDLLRTTPARPRYLALDTQAGLLYWTGDNGAEVWRAKLDGSESQILVPGGAYASTGGIVLQRGSSRLYWNDAANEIIYRARADGTAVQPIIYRRLRDPQGLALDETAGKMIWADRGRGQILRANLNGFQVEVLVQERVSTPTSLALDLLRGKMVWTEPFMQQINQANLDGSGVETLLSAEDGLVRPNLIALDVSAGKMYWGDYGSHSIRRADRDGSHIEDLVTSGIQVPSGLALQIIPPEIQHSYMPAIPAN